MNDIQHKKVDQAILYIRTHLHRKLSLKEIADAVSYSPYHFHRLFVDVMEMTVHQYVKNTRLEKAVYDMERNPEKSLMLIAEKLGFYSAANFCRAFKAHYGIPPSSYRKNIDRKNAWESKPKINAQWPIDPSASLSFSIEAADIPLMNAACRKLTAIRGGTFDSKIEKAFQKLETWFIEKSIDPSCSQFMLCSYDMNWMCPPGERMYDVCMSLDDENILGNKDIKVKKLPGGRYAVCTLEANEGTVSFEEAIQCLTWASEYMYMHWITDQGFYLDDKPGLNFFLSPPDSPAIKMTCCLPISPIKNEKSKK